MSRTLAWHACIVVLAAAVAGAGLAAPGSVPWSGGLASAAGAQAVTVTGGAQGFPPMADLVWLASGLLELTKQPASKKIGLGKDQARKVLAIVQGLVKEGLVSLEFKEDQVELPLRVPQQGQQRTLNDSEREKLRKEREERERKLADAVSAIEGILTSAQVSFIDNLDVDLELYGFGQGAQGVRAWGQGRQQGQGGQGATAGQGSAGAQSGGQAGGQGQGQGGAFQVDPARLKAIRDAMVKAMKERAKLFQTLVSTLTRLAK